MLLFMHSIKCERRALEASGIAVLFLFHRFLPLVSSFSGPFYAALHSCPLCTSRGTVLIASNGKNPEGVQHTGPSEKHDAIFLATKTKSLDDAVDCLLLPLLKSMTCSPRIIFLPLQLLYLPLI